MGKLSRYKDIKLDAEPSLRKKERKKTAPKECDQDKLTRSHLASIRKEQILQAALRVFSRSGPNKATNQAIAEEAGFSSPALIYHYFTDRQDLLVQVVKRFHPILHFLTEVNTQKLESYSDMLYQLKKLYSAIDNLSKDKEKSACFRVIFSESLNNSESGVIKVKEADDIHIKITNYLTSIFSKGQELGFIRRDFLADQIACNLSTFLSAQFFNELLNLRPVALDIDMQLECFLHGVGAQTNTAQ
ncbi:MAG: TetR/AcrR family transcriptional regulator [Candidatus Bruticola sp.]